MSNTEKPPDSFSFQDSSNSWRKNKVAADGGLFVYRCTFMLDDKGKVCGKLCVPKDEEDCCAAFYLYKYSSCSEHVECICQEVIFLYHKK